MKEEVVEELTEEEKHLLKVAESLSPGEYNLMQMLTLGFTEEEIMSNLDEEKKLSEADILIERKMIPVSWKSNGFGAHNPPRTKEDWVKIYKVAGKEDDYSDKEIEEFAGSPEYTTRIFDLFKTKLA